MAFCRFINNTTDWGSTTAKHQAVLHQNGVWHVQNLQTEGSIFEHRFPEHLLPKWQEMANAHQFQHIPLQDCDNLYIILQPNSEQGAVQKILVLISALPQMLMMTLQRTPLCRSGLLPTFHTIDTSCSSGQHKVSTSLTSLAGCGTARDSLKRVGDDRRIYSGVWNDQNTSQESITLQLNQAKLTMPSSSSTYTARCYVALFGGIAQLNWPGRMQVGYSLFLYTYTYIESALLCHGMSFELSDGEIAFDATIDRPTQDAIRGRGTTMDGMMKHVPRNAWDL